MNRLGLNEKTPHIPEIASEIDRLIRSGVKMKVIFDYIQQFDQAPHSYMTFMKVYKTDIAKARSDIQSEMGSVVIEAARGGDWKAAELFLRTKAGWNQTIEVEEVDSEEKEETGAIDELIALLGIEEDQK
jgi:hypothetical protein